MNRTQLNFVMDLLGFTAINRRLAIEHVIIHGDSAYAAELFGDLPKNTINRDCIKCALKWDECLKIALFVRENV